MAADFDNNFVKSSAADRMRQLFTTRLHPDSLDIIDDSARHAGHAETRAHATHGETHFNVRIVSARFEGMSRVDRHRLVYGLLEEEFKAGLHALQLELKTPAENHL